MALSFDEWMTKIYQDWDKEVKANTFFVDEFTNKMMPRYRKYIEDEQKKEQRYAFTITTNAPLNGYPKAEEEMKTAVIKLFAQKSQEILEGAAYLEYTSKGAPHIHGWYQIQGGGRIYAKNFKRVWGLWDETKKHGAGFQGGYHAKLKDDRYVGYASAEDRLIVKV